MEAQLEEERRKREEIEARLEQERKMREEQELRMQSMFAYMQGLGASVNYRPPTVPQMTFAPIIYLPSGPAVTPVSMNFFTFMRIQ